MSNIDLTWMKANFPELSNIQPLNKGGQKLVFSAVHPRDGMVVLKIIHPHAPDDDIVLREMSAVEQVQSDRVPRILINGKAPTPIGDCFWLCEERIIGKTVRECLQNGPLNIKSLLRLGLHMLEALVRVYTKTNYAIFIYAASANSTGSHNRLSIKRIDAT